jgi:N-acetylglucosaminylphosphatidylinositol deacetylase
MVSFSVTSPAAPSMTAAAESQSQSPSTVVHVFVFAHPDDESMFFLPTIRSLVDDGETVWFLCLTTGNYDGLGKLREKEMEQAGKLLGASKVIVRNDDDNNNDSNTNSNGNGKDGSSDKRANSILDHPTKRYDKIIVARAIRDSLSRQNLGNNNTNTRFVLITFDAMGVSGHVNHTDVYLGVLHLMEEEQEEHQPQNRKKLFGSTAICRDGGHITQEDDPLVFLEAWYLASEQNVLFKYAPVLSWMLLLLSCFVSTFTSTSTSMSTSIASSGTSTRCCSKTRMFRMHDPRLNWAAMATHRSQFVWYRRLFVVFSSYTYYNKLLCCTNTKAKTKTKKTTTTQ